MKRRHIFAVFGATMVAALAAPAAPETTEIVVISGPILPKVLVLYIYEGENYPVTQADKEQLVTDTALNFELLLVDCAADYPKIKLWNAGDPPLSATELTDNYDAVAQCAYEKHTSKPYWIPQLILDVDICEQTLGTGWRLPTEADVLALTPDDLQVVQQTLTPQGETSWGGFYFSLQMYAMGNDGKLKVADLGPGVSERISAGPEGTNHHESGLSLRCLKSWKE
jgi:hypothetical protein